MRKHLKKGDIVLFAAFAAAAVLIACIPFVRLQAAGDGTDSSGNAAKVVITIAGEEYGTWPLDQNRVLKVDDAYGFNEVTIQDSTVAVTRSDCANQICVDTGAISRSGEMIVCLPHRLAVTIQSGEGTSGNEYDAISR